MHPDMFKNLEELVITDSVRFYEGTDATFSKKLFRHYVAELLCVDCGCVLSMEFRGSGLCSECNLVRDSICLI